MPVNPVTSSKLTQRIVPSQAYHPGQIVRGQLIERMPGDLWRIKLGNAEMSAKLTGSAVPGSSFNARITSTSPQLTLQILEGAEGKTLLGSAGLPTSGSLSELAQMTRLLGPEAARLFQPSLAWTNPSTLTPQITQWIEGFGHFFEARLSHILADLLQANPLFDKLRLQQHRGLRRLMNSDLKPLLLRLKNRLAGQNDGQSQKLAGRLERWITAYGPDEAGTLSFPLPWEGGEARLEFKLPNRFSGKPSRQLTLELDSPAMGPMRVAFLSLPPQLILRLSAERQETLDLFISQQSALENSLKPHFLQVDIRVGEWGEHIVFKRPVVDVKG